MKELTAKWKWCE